MYAFIYWIKAIAAILITNSHYGKIWPYSSMAFGGMLGNCLFFAAAGFLLWNLKGSFFSWYGKRILRIYPAFWLAVVIEVLAGRYEVRSLTDIWECFLYPTRWFHFIASILVLYIFYYVLISLSKRYSIDLRWIMTAVFVIYLAIYLFAYDKSYYHIDYVEERMVRFLFMESMLLGALFRSRMPIESIDRKRKYWKIIGMLFWLVLYLASKVAFDRYSEISRYQILNQIIMLILIYQIFKMAIDLENAGSALGKIPLLPVCVRFIAGLTLEIYAGQYLILYLLPSMSFPLRFIAATGMILVYAWLLHIGAQLLEKLVRHFVRRQET